MVNNDRENESFYCGLFEAAPTPFLVLDADDFRIVAANDAYLEAVIASRDELIGKHIFEAFPDPDPAIDTGSANIGAALERVKLTRKVDVMPVQRYPVPRRGGGYEDRYWSPVHAPVFDAAGHVRYIIQRPENVTELVLLKNRAVRNDADRRALAERTEQMESDILQRSAELRRLNEHLRIAQRVATIGSWEYRPESGESRYSDEIYRILGYTSNYPPEKEDWAMNAVHEGDRPLVESMREKLMSGEEIRPSTFRIRRTDGKIRYVQARAEFERDEKGGVRTIYGTLQDITDQQETEHALRVSEERFRLVAKATADTVFDWNVGADQVWWNEGLRTTFGYEPVEHGDADAFWKKLIHPEDRSRIRDSLDNAIGGGKDEWREQYRFLRNGGEIATVTVRAFLIREGSGKVVRIVGSVNDVTLQRRYEEKLREQANLLDKAQDAIIVHGTDYRIRYWNKGAERLYQWSREEVEGRSMVSLLCKEPAAFVEAVNTTIEHGDWSGRILQHRKDGMSLTIDGTWSLVTDEDGNPDAILAINTDVTTRMQLEEQLRQAQRLEAVGQLTGGVAHDFNNLLTVILGNAELLMEPGRDTDDSREMAALIRETAQKGSDLTQRLLAFARQQNLKPRIVNVNSLLGGMEMLVRRTLPEQIKVEIIAAHGVWDTYVDSARLESAILNLAINARDAMPSGGHLVIETANVTVDKACGADGWDAEPGDYVVISVSDTGEGIKPEHLDKIFDPFFTTKEKGKGTGLGLSMTYGFVKQSNGNVTVSSEERKGTTIKIYLPRAGQEEALQEEQELTPDEPQGDECVLVVEDDAQVRKLAIRNLERLGYEVIAAPDGPSALDILRETDAIDLLFTDVVMAGGMNGRELALLAKETQPDLPVLFTSGYTENVMAHVSDVEDSEELDLLEKPYRRSELAQRVRSTLQRKQTSRKDGD